MSELFLVHSFYHIQQCPSESLILTKPLSVAETERTQFGNIPADKARVEVALPNAGRETSL